MIKQTQTKMFDFSDVGLDFCAGSKTKFPEVFKKMLVTGFNPQTVSSVATTDDQITLTYGVSHGYKADRILAVTASGGFNKEVYIDSVTSNTVTCIVLDGDTSGLTGMINTKVASLGWSIEYEVGNIHIYKFKAMDESDLYLRLCYQDVTTRRNCISPCVGKTADLVAGTITDANALAENTSITSPNAGFKWEFQTAASSTFDGYTYSQGYATYGKGSVIGSPYHLIILSNGNTNTIRAMTNGILPAACFNYDKLKYPALFGYTYGNITTAFDNYELGNQRIYIGSVSVVCETTGSQSSNYAFDSVFNKSSYLSSALDNFNTTTAEPLSIYEDSTGQIVGFAYGAFKVRSASSTLYPTNFQQTPSITVDVDFEHSIIVHAGGSTGTESSNGYFLAFPLEEIKLGY